MTDRVELATEVVELGVEKLRTMHNMQELQSLFCRIVKAPTAPKFSDKGAAAKRVVQMAQEVLKTADPVPVPELNEVFGVSVVKDKKRGRPKNKPREYFFTEGNDKAPRLAAQAVALVDHMLDWAPDQWIPEEQVRHFVLEAALNGALNTKQDPWRIFQYYRAQLISKGFCRMRNVADEG